MILLQHLVANETRDLQRYPEIIPPRRRFHNRLLRTMARLGRLYEYEALRNTRSIRVVKLFPALQRDHSIVIELSELLSSSAIEYEALSYTWDDQKPTKALICNGRTLRVTENVFQALRQLRSRKGLQRIIWIDAICINQKDQAEKTAQVCMMGDIFSRAQRVNIWLSRPTEAMLATFQYVRLADGPELVFSHVSDGIHFHTKATRG